MRIESDTARPSVLGTVKPSRVQVVSLVGLNEEGEKMFWNKYKQQAEHYKCLFERYYAESNRYQAMLFHSWKTIREQNKGLNRQARKIKRLRKMLKLSSLTLEA